MAAAAASAAAVTTAAAPPAMPAASAAPATPAPAAAAAAALPTRWYCRRRTVLAWDAPPFASRQRSPRAAATRRTARPRGASLAGFPWASCPAQWPFALRPTRRASCWSSAAAAPACCLRHTAGRRSSATTARSVRAPRRAAEGDGDAATAPPAAPRGPTAAPALTVESAPTTAPAAAADRWLGRLRRTGWKGPPAGAPGQRSPPTPQLARWWRSTDLCVGGRRHE